MNVQAQDVAFPRGKVNLVAVEHRLQEPSAGALVAMRLLVLAALAACSRANIGAPKPSTAVPVGPNAGGPGAAWDWRRQLNDVLPHVQVRVAPLTNLKLRKNIRWLSTLLSVGADYSTQQGVWSMKYSWEDSLIGGRLTLKGSELQLHKAWVFALGGASSLAATLRLRGAVDLTTGKTSARLGFRTEQASGAINIVEGVDLVKKLPLDGADGHAKLEVKLRVAFPQPDIAANREARTERADADEPRSDVYVGMGDLEIDVDELNLCLDW